MASCLCLGLSPAVDCEFASCFTQRLTNCILSVVSGERGSTSFTIPLGDMHSLLNLAINHFPDLFLAYRWINCDYKSKNYKRFVLPDQHEPLSASQQHHLTRDHLKPLTNPIATAYLQIQLRVPSAR